ncbi:MAG: hypothetical protein KJ061_06705 [Vicinamibacteraceae bacterium]|nr:hypothetical protein [Vicinamibacteraceae bacterium]
MRSILRAMVVAAPLVAAFAWFVPSGAEQAADAALPVPPAPPSTVPARGLTAAAFPDLRTSERIATYLEHAPEPDTAARNPFRFAERRTGDPSQKRPVARGAGPSAEARASAPLAPADLFPLSLIGLADIDGDSPHRVAILSSPGALFHAVAGETLLDRFTVGEVTADGVDVTDIVTGRVHRLVFR